MQHPDGEANGAPWRECRVYILGLLRISSLPQDSSDLTWRSVPKFNLGTRASFAEGYSERVREQAERRNAFCDDQADALFFSTMSTVVEIIDAVKQLDEKQKNEFLAKLAEIDFDDAWDRQIDADARAGRLDFLWEEAKRDIKEGRTRPLDELLGHE